ncbi:non-ribosomal peptide synthetase [Paenibacillus sp. J22TS3]|uniref:non-ribosomal peptide synthetase n=1 Tax=Paenibacillus sp. J22TS3 TaxID=2807192 RepID=UPI001B2CE922|nr:non-ribosomal peptide synthetase [Paenibacillus sp. J22TS3]GIP23203.1 hypothetical protein J22TS3_34780 [Paenibacillus sp. J22TS3]
MLVDKPVVYRLCHPQKRIWYNEQFYPQTAVNHIGGCVRILGPLNFKALEAAIHSVIQAHDGLRLQLQPHDEEPVQYVAAYNREALPFYDFSIHPNPKTAYDAWVTAESQAAYNLYHSPLYHIAMFSLGEQDNGFLIRAHHIVCDGWSMDVLTKHILNRYQLIWTQDAPEPEAPQPSYVKYFDMEKEYLQSERCKKNRLYWEEKFAKLPEPLFEQTPRNPSGKRLTRLLDKEAVTRLKDAADKHQVSFPIFLGAAFGILLSRYYQKDEVVLSMPIANRNPITKATVGMFTDNLPLTIQVKENMPLHKFLRNTKREYMHNLGNRKYPYDLLARQLQLRKKGRSALAQASFNYYNTHLRTSLGDSLIINEEFYSGEQAYPLQLMVKDWSDDGTLLFSLDYQTGLIQDFEAESLLGSMLQLLSAMASSPDSWIHTLPLLDKPQWEAAVERYNSQSAHFYDENLTVLDLFRVQARKHPGHIAVSWDEGEMTYGELWEKVHLVSSVLAAKLNIQSGAAPVAIRMSHSPELIIAIWAVIKAGAAFVPIAIDTPRSRVEYILRDSEAVYMLSDEDAEEWGVPVIHIPALLSRLDNREELPKVVPSGCSVFDPAYIIYTSGSTGEPKGVRIRHLSLANYITWAGSVYPKSDDDVFAFYSSLSFDLTLTSLFVPLTSGRQLRIYPPRNHEYTLSRILQENKATVIKLTPSHLALLPDRQHPNAVLHTLIVGGESLKTSLAARIQERFGPSLSIYNEYGPTEATVGCMVHLFNSVSDQDSAVPIGIPAANANLYVLDKYQQMLPPGAVGELYISGCGVADGYIHQHELTAERFLPDPFKEGSRMYRTGDRVRLGEGYLMHYLGRHDDQVKIRGYRIEPAEIEHAILGLGGIRDAVVFTAGEDQHAELLAWVVSGEEEAAGIRQELLGKLPAFMIPDRIIAVSEIPLTSNGKADKQQLLQMVHGGQRTWESRYEASTYSDHLLSAIRTVLENDQIGLEEQFFQLGGDSIKAIQVSSLLKSQGLDLNPAVILDYPLIKDMLPHLKQDFCTEEQGPAEGEVVPAPIQSWFLDQQFENPDYYLQSIMLEVADGISAGVLADGLKTLIRHHDSLRLYYDAERKKLFYNNNLPLDDFTIEVMQVNAQSKEEQDIELEQKLTSFKGQIRLSDPTSPLIKTCLILYPGRKRRLLLAAHHLCIDGVSWRILLEDLERLIGTRQPLPPKTTSFQRWSKALVERSLPIFQSEIDWWRHNGEGETPPLPKTDGYQKPFRSGCCKQKISFNTEDTTAILRGHSDMTAAELMQVSLVMAWHDAFPCKELTMWLEGHGREALFADLNISRTVGWFTSLYPVKFELESVRGEYETSRSILRRLKQVPHRGVGYGVLAYSLNQIPLAEPQIVFNYLGEFSQLEEGIFRIVNEASGPDVAPENHFPFLLEMNAIVMNRQLQIELTYSPASLDADRMEQLVCSYQSKLLNLLQEQDHLSEEEFRLTPDDFDAVDLTQQELDTLFK